MEKKIDKLLTAAPNCKKAGMSWREFSQGYAGKISPDDTQKLVGRFFGLDESMTDSEAAEIAQGQLKRQGMIT
jgi:hypothetical protein